MMSEHTILNLPQPIVALAPMDGVTDSPFRFIAKKYGNPDLIFTEFTNVMGMCIAGDKIMHTFHYDESQRPIVGQIYGNDPEYFYHAAKIICALGFDAVDINMGCPAKNVAASGSGAGLIKTPELAKEIVFSVKRGVMDWVEDAKLTGLTNRSLRGFEELIAVKKKEIEVSSNINETSLGLKNLVSYLEKTNDRDIIPVSVKTRIGYDQPITESWISEISTANPEWISVHGRTLKQMYEGSADWSEIAKAVASTDIPILANGDVKSVDDFNNILTQTKSYGALIGRASFGNPWIFKSIREVRATDIDLPTKIDVMLEHTKKFVELYPDPKAFFQMRKHFGWYMKSFDGALETRKKLMLTTSLKDVEAIVASIKGI